MLLEITTNTFHVFWKSVTFKNPFCQILYIFCRLGSNSKAEQLKRRQKVASCNCYRTVTDFFLLLGRPAGLSPLQAKVFLPNFPTCHDQKHEKGKKNVHKYLIYYYKTFSQFTRDLILKQKLKVSSLITNGPNIMLGILLDCFDLFIIFIICISIFILY